METDLHFLRLRQATFPPLPPYPLSRTVSTMHKQNGNETFNSDVIAFRPSLVVEALRRRYHPETLGAWFTGTKRYLGDGAPALVFVNDARAVREPAHAFKVLIPIDKLMWMRPGVREGGLCNVRRNVSCCLRPTPGHNCKTSYMPCTRLFHQFS